MDELKKKAAELERAERLSEALEHFLRLARETEGPHAAAYWRRAASLQKRLGQTADAADSYARALDGFIAAGLRNDAIVTGLDLLANGDPDPGAVLRLLELANEGRYGRFARTAATELLRAAVVTPDPTMLDAVAGYLARSAGTPANAVEELLEALPGDDRSVALPALKAIWSRLAETNGNDAAEAVRAAIGRIDPTEKPGPSAPLRDGPRPKASDDANSGPDDTLPLIAPSSPPVDDEPPSIPLLEGLEPTHAALDDDPSIVSGDSLVVEHTSLADSSPVDAEPVELTGREEEVIREEVPAEEDEEEYVEEEEGYAEPLPLLEVPSRTQRAEGGGPTDDAEGFEDILLDDGQPSGTPDDEEDAELDVDAILQDLSSIATGDVEAGDPASHYDVAVAFKEMGMTRDALARLRAALEGGYNPLATLEVVGEILVTDGEVRAAARILGHARAAGDAPDVERAGVLYWLARSEEALGRAKEAGRLFGRVVRAVPDYRDAAERLGRLPEPRL